MASFVNGDFETGDLTGWTVAPYLNYGLLAASPTLRTQLNLQPGGTNRTRIISGTAESVLPEGLSLGASLRVPKYGSKAVVVNAMGTGNNVNGIKQSMVTTNADVDPNDGKVHVRFALAPVLQNPGHGATEQPYFWATLTNVTKGNLVIFYTFNYSSQLGVPWKTDPSTGTLYTDWQSFDISPGAAQLAVGDTLELEVIAAGCSQGGHYGHVYLDGIGPYLPGLGVAATAPAAVNSGAQLTYTFAYANNGSGAASSTTITETLPAGTTFASVSAAGATCTTPAVGGTGDVTCNLGTVNPASSGSISVTVNVTAGSGSTISNGTYSIAATGVSALIGPLVTTAVTSGVTYADLRTTATDGVAALNWGATTIYVVTVTNAGPGAANGATITVPVPTNVSALTSWSCASSGGATCAAASGSGAISASASALPSGGQVAYTIVASVASGTGASSISLQATAVTPGGVTDSNATNNVAVDYDQVGTLRTLSLTKSGSGVGTVLSSPAAINCGTACSSQGAVFLDGTTIVLTASTTAGSRFVSWTAGPCAGITSPTCSVPLSADVTVTADFLSGDWLVAGSAPGGNGTVSCTSPLLNGQSSTCTITAAARSNLSTLTDNGANVLGSVSGGTYGIASVTADHAVVGSFIANSDSVGLAASTGTSSRVGQSVTLTATVTAGVPAGTPTGTVAFRVGGVDIAGCATQAVSAGSATCTIADLAVGAAQPVTAAFSGDATYPPATSSTLSFTVNQGATSVALGSDHAPSVFAQSVTWTATIGVTSPAIGTPTGTVTFSSGGASICSGVAVFGGTATCTTSALSVANHSITATYTGDGNFSTSTSSAFSQVVTKAATALVIADSPTGSTARGVAVVLETTISVTSPGAGTPSGTIAFTDGGVTVTGCALLPLVAGAASCTTATVLSIGFHTFAATYSGDASFSASTGSLSHEVFRANPTAVTLASSQSPSLYGQPVTYSVAVTGAYSTPTGTVGIMEGATTLCTVTLSGGSGTCSHSALSPGTHGLVASYSGDLGYFGMSSSAISQLVVRGTATPSVVSDMATSVFGQTVTFTAQVIPDIPSVLEPAGNVTFRDSATTICANVALVDVGGVATAACSTSTFSVNWHAVSARYNGSTGYANSTSFPVTVQVGLGATSVGLASSLNPAVAGQPVTITAVVTATSPAVGTPAGAVAFTDGGATIPGCGSIALASGSASCTSSSLSAATHAITATYGGSTTFATGASPVLSQVVARGATAVGLASSVNPSAFGQSVVLTATVSVSTGFGTPTGTVTFSDGLTALCSAVALAGPSATCTASGLTAATHSIIAAYGGDASFTGSTSSAISQVVSKGTTTVVLAGSPASPTVFGQSIIFTASVTAVAPATGTPGGTVTFKDGAATIGTTTLDGAGRATFSTSTLAVGGHPVSAEYGGDAGFGASASAARPATVGRGATSMDLAASTWPSIAGLPVTFTASVMATAPAGGTPTGSVTFWDGGGTISGCAAVTMLAGVATCTTSALAVGTHAISATYSGDASFLAPVEGSLSHDVVRASPTIAMTSSQSPSLFGQPVSMSFTVSGGYSTPSGSVTVLDGTTTICSADLAGGAGTCAHDLLTPGTHTLVAHYGGDATYLEGSSVALSQQVVRGTATPSVVSDMATSVYGQTVTFTAQVVSDSPSVVIPTGTVTFRDSASTICDSVGLDGAGHATCSTLALSVNWHAVSARYNGSTGYANSTSFPVTVQVGQGATSVAISASPDGASVFGQEIAFTATVTPTLPSTGIPTGTIAFSDGATAIAGCEAVALLAGQATCSTYGQAVGAHAIGAAFGGSVNYVASNATSAYTVDKGGTTVALASSMSPSVFGQSVTLSATVGAIAPAAGSPTGTVAFTEDGATIADCGAVAVSGGVATCTSSALVAGTHALAASYSGDGRFAASSIGFSQVVDKAATTLVLTSSDQFAPVTAPPTLAAALTVSSPWSGSPTGTVTFSSNGSSIGTSAVAGGVAAFSGWTPEGGTYSLTASYTGDANFLASSAAPLPQQILGLFPVAESFKNDAAIGWDLDGTALLTSGVNDPTGDGWLRLTDAASGEAGSATFRAPFSSANGIVATFDYATWGGDGADGFSFYLIDGATPVATVGAPGGSLGYVGVSNGYVGIGFDEYGSFSSNIGDGGPGPSPDSIAVRGSGSLGAGFAYLAGVPVSEGIATGSRDAARPVRISIIDRKLKVELKLGATWTTSIDGLDLASAVAQGALPPTFKMGFSGSTGASTNVHEIRNLNVALPATLTVASVGSPNPAAAGQPVTWTVTVTNDALNPVPGLGFSLPVPAGVTDLTWSIALAGGATSSAASGSGDVIELLDLPRSSSAVFTVTGTPGTSLSGTTVTSVTALSVPPSISNLGNDTASGAILVSQLPSTVLLAASPSPATYGAPVTFTATVSGAGAVPTGTVTFLDGGSADLCGAVALVAGVATCAAPALAVGTHGIGATYSGDTPYLPVSGALEQQVDKAAPAVLLASATNPSAYGDPVNFTATVTSTAPGGDAPAGTVLFLDDATVVGSGTIGAGGQATFASDLLRAGTHPLTASYQGDGSFLAVASAPVTQVVGQAPTAAVVAVAPAASVFGQGVTFSITVDRAPAATGFVPEGDVELWDGATRLQVLPLTGGVATWATSALEVGAHSLTASYLGSADWQASASTPVDLVVAKAPTATALVADLSDTVFGQPVQLTATVTIPAPGAGPPTGTVTFRDGLTTLGTAGVAPATGMATLSWSALAVGSHDLVATYDADGHFLSSSSGVAPLVVSKASTSVVLAPTVSPSAFGQSITFMVTVSPVSPGAGTPSGSVVIEDDTATLATISLSSATGAFTTGALTVGSHALTARYGGDGSFLASSGTATQPVEKAATAVTVASSSTPSRFGQLVTWTTTVGAAAPGVGAPAGGTVAFSDGGVPVAGCAAAPVAAGVATCTSGALAAGNHTVQAAFSGDTGFLAGAGQTTQVVEPSAVTLAFTATPSPAVYGQLVTFRLDLGASAPGRGTPATGTVTFTENGTHLCGPVAVTTGVASCPAEGLVAGTHALTAAFSGDPNFAATTASASLVVTPGTAHVAVVSSRNPSRRGRPITFTATITSSWATPVGTVTFSDGETLLGTATVTAGVATFSTRGLVKGDHAITAEYVPSADFAGGTGTLSPAQVVENTPPVAGSGDALALGAGGALRVDVPVSGGALDHASTTVESWVRAAWTTVAEVTAPTVFRLGTASATRLQLGISPDRSSLLLTVGVTASELPAALDDGAWHHLALVATASEVTLLVDGVRVGNVAGGLPAGNPSTTLTLGRDFLGDLDEVRIWSTARTAADLSASARTPLHGAETGLIGYWRMDEGSGTELFDASGNTLDGALVLDQVASPMPFVASTAWSKRDVWQERDMAPADAGYDADGDLLTLSVGEAPLHGTASVDSTALQVGYHAGGGYLGADHFTFTLDDGSAASHYTLELSVHRALVCSANADCGGGDLCLEGLCQSPAAVSGRAGGCSSGSASATALWALLALVFLSRPRGRREVPAPARRRSLLLPFATVVLTLAAQTATAQTPHGFNLQSYDPPPAGDRFFAMPDATTPGHGQLAVGLVLSWATDPLILRLDGQPVPGGDIVHQQFWGFAQGSIGLGERFLLEATLPVALYQSGSQPLPDLAQVTTTALGDLRLGGRFALGAPGGVAVAAALDLFLPTGSTDAFSSDGTVRVQPKVLAGGDWGQVRYGAELGYMVRSSKDATLTTTGPALTYAAAAAWCWSEFRVGPELYGRYQFDGTATSPFEGLLGGHWARDGWDVGLALGTGLNDSPGSAPFRAVTQVSWRPGAKAVAAQRAAAASAAAEQAAAERAAAEKAAAEKAAAERSAAERAAAEKAAAERSAAEQAAAAAAVPPPTMATLTAERIEISQAVQFDSGLATIRPESVPLLRDVSAVLTSHPEISRVRIEGHTDSQGQAALNVQLSEQRAGAVLRWLVDQGGIDPARLSARGFGDANPVATNVTPDGRNLNRRVEFKINLP